MVARTVSFFVASEGESRPIVVISSLDSLLESSVPRFHSTVPPKAPLKKAAEESLGACTEITVRGEGSVTVTCPLCTPARPTFKARTWTPKFVPDFAVSGASTVSRTTDRFPVVVSESSWQPPTPTRPTIPAARNKIRQSLIVPPEKGRSKGRAVRAASWNLESGIWNLKSPYNSRVLERLRARRVGYPAAVLLVLATIGILKLFPGLADSSVALLLLLSVFLAARPASAASRRGGTRRSRRDDPPLAGVPFRYQPRIPPWSRRRPAARRARRGARHNPAGQRRAGPRRCCGNLRRGCPEGPRGARLPPGQFGRLSVPARRNRHLSPDSGGTAASGSPRRDRDAGKRGSRGGMCDPARPGSGVGAVPAPRAGGGRDEDE